MFRCHKRVPLSQATSTHQTTNSPIISPIIWYYLWLYSATKHTTPQALRSRSLPLLMGAGLEPTPAATPTKFLKNHKCRPVLKSPTSRSQGQASRCPAQSLLDWYIMDIISSAWNEGRPGASRVGIRLLSKYWRPIHTRRLSLLYYYD